MRSVRCMTGLHAWERTVVREEGGLMSLHQRCTRCGKVRIRSASAGPPQTPDTHPDNISREFDAGGDF
jgi:hypothetical protein